MFNYYGRDPNTAGSIRHNTDISAQFAFLRTRQFFHCGWARIETLGRRNASNSPTTRQAAVASESQLTLDLDSLLNIQRTSLRQERRTHWHFMLAIILSSVFILEILLLLFRSYFIGLASHCCTANRTEQKAIEQTPSPHPPQPKERTHEPLADDLKRNVTFASYTLQDNW
jgi:hypothetical protein